MEDNRIRVMLGAVVRSFSQWGVVVHRATTLPYLAPHRQRGVRAADDTVNALSCVAMWMGFAARHVGDADGVSIIVDRALVAGAAYWWRA